MLVSYSRQPRLVAGVKSCLKKKTPGSQCSIYICVYPHRSQAVKKWFGIKSLGEKTCEIKGGGQEMAAMMSILINVNNAHSHY